MITMSPSANTMTASVIIPTLNERAHIGALLDQLLAEPADIVGELLVGPLTSTAQLI